MKILNKVISILTFWGSITVQVRYSFKCILKDCRSDYPFFLNHIFNYATVQKRQGVTR